MRNRSGLYHNLSGEFETIKRIENNTLFLPVKTVKPQCLSDKYNYRRILHGHFQPQIHLLFFVRFLKNTKKLFSNIIVSEL